ncbi:membrane protein insertion efficiency factor YidD [Flavobacterium oreochromis]|uniref:membrane protein insertion efficiency factor YidD n=1 Tax=Flavobacterium oreochromis TaxID=2906078 RepID=UPI00385D3CD5
MKYLILLIIRVYWITKPKHSKPKCIFKKSCSKYVYEETFRHGFLKGLKAFYFRYKNCRNGFEIFKNPITDDIQMILPSGNLIEEKEIANRLIINLKINKMKSYYVNKNAQANGDHEVHESGYLFLPSVENRIYIGEFNNCQKAVKEAKKHYTKVNGCYYCSNPCNTK